MTSSCWDFVRLNSFHNNEYWCLNDLKYLSISYELSFGWIRQNGRRRKIHRQNSFCSPCKTLLPDQYLSNTYQTKNCQHFHSQGFENTFSEWRLHTMYQIWTAAQQLSACIQRDVWPYEMYSLGHKSFNIRFQMTYLRICTTYCSWCLEYVLDTHSARSLSDSINAVISVLSRCIWIILQIAETWNSSLCADDTGRSRMYFRKYLFFVTHYISPLRA